MQSYSSTQMPHYGTICSIFNRMNAPLRSNLQLCSSREMPHHYGTTCSCSFTQGCSIRGAAVGVQPHTNILRELCCRFSFVHKVFNWKMLQFFTPPKIFYRWYGARQKQCLTLLIVYKYSASRARWSSTHEFSGY